MLDFNLSFYEPICTSTYVSVYLYNLISKLYSVFSISFYSPGSKFNLYFTSLSFSNIYATLDFAN